MTSGKSPYSVDQVSILRSLEQQNAWAFGIVWIVLNQFRSFHAFDKFSCK